MMMDLPEMIRKHNMNITGILHCGANEGQEAALYHSVCDGNVFWIEAIPDVYEALVENLKPYPNQHAMRACIGNKDGEIVKFNISNNESQSSSYLELGHHSIIHPTVVYEKSIALSTTRLDTLFWGVEGKSLLNFGNFDLQGVEKVAIESMGGFLDQFEYLWVEVNKKETYVGCMLVDDLDYFLLQKGFERVETGVWVADTWTDALYIRKYKL
jgi:FkbM family methyltransferase